jgi:hypothetical protein
VKVVGAVEAGLWVEQKQERKIDTRQSCREPNVVDITAGTVLNHDRGEEWADGGRARGQDCISGRENSVREVDVEGTVLRVLPGHHRSAFVEKEDIRDDARNDALYYTISHLQKALRGSTGKGTRSYLSSSSGQARQTSRCEKAVEAVDFCGPDENSKMHRHGCDECKTLAKLNGQWHPDKVADAEKEQVELSFWSIRAVPDGDQLATYTQQSVYIIRRLVILHGHHLGCDGQTAAGKVGREVGQGSGDQGGNLQPLRPPQWIPRVVRWRWEQMEVVVMVAG